MHHLGGAPTCLRSRSRCRSSRAHGDATALLVGFTPPVDGDAMRESEPNPLMWDVAVAPDVLAWTTDHGDARETTAAAHVAADTRTRRGIQR